MIMLILSLEYRNRLRNWYIDSKVSHTDNPHIIHSSVPGCSILFGLFLRQESKSDSMGFLPLMSLYTIRSLGIACALLGGHP